MPDLTPRPDMKLPRSRPPLWPAGRNGLAWLLGLSLVAALVAAGRG